MSKTTITHTGTLTLRGETYAVRQALRRNGWRWSGADRCWTKHVVAGHTVAIRPRCVCYLTVDGTHEEITVYGGGPHLVSTPTGALLDSRYTQAQRTEMQRSGIDTDCDDHDLI